MSADPFENRNSSPRIAGARNERNTLCASAAPMSHTLAAARAASALAIA